MNRIVRFLVVLLAVGGTVAAAQVGGETQHASTDWAEAVVRVEFSRKLYDLYQPWSRRTGRTLKTGLVVGPREVLTTAQDVSDHTLVRLQKGGRGEWTLGRLVWVDYRVNLAMVTTAEAGFWQGLRPAAWLDGAPARDAALQIVRWREGKLESRRAEFTQFTVRPSETSGLNYAQLEADSEIQGAGSGEPVVVGNRAVGLVSYQSSRGCRVIPGPFIRQILEARGAGQARSPGYFHFYWAPAENVASLAHLGLPGPPRGVLITKVPKRLDGQPNVVRRCDVLLQVDDFEVDMQGDYADPVFGPLMLEHLAVRGHWAGDPVRLRVWREGREHTLAYQLPPYDFAHDLVPWGPYDRPPDYLIVGGLVFQPLTRAYLQQWGADWEQRAPFRLRYFVGEEATPEQPAVVILSQVLPDPYNIGYQDLRYLVLQEVNGRRVHTLAQLQEALRHPEGEFHVLEFLANDSFRRVVLAAAGADRQATARVLDRYGIPQEAVIAGEPVTSPPPATATQGR